MDKLKLSCLVAEGLVLLVKVDPETDRIRHAGIPFGNGKVESAMGRFRCHGKLALLGISGAKRVKYGRIGSESQVIGLLGQCYCI